MKEWMFVGIYCWNCGRSFRSYEDDHSFIHSFLESKFKETIRSQPSEISKCDKTIDKYLILYFEEFKFFLRQQT